MIVHSHIISFKLTRLFTRRRPCGARGGHPELESPNLMWQMSPCDRICMKLMCPRNDLGSTAFLFRDIVVRCVEKSILSACLGGSRLAAAIRQVAKAGYLGGPAALRGGSELRGIGRYHGGDAVGPAILTWRPCFDDAFTADLWTPPWGAHLL